MIARWLWSLALWFLLPLYFMRLWWRGRREPGYRKDWAERLGHSSVNVPAGSIWVHAVSLGETHAAAALV